MPTTIRRATAPIHGLKDFTLQTEVDGTFEAVVAVFGNVDLGGDRIVPGAFRKSLEQWVESGSPIPVIWSHGWDDPNNHIGEVLEAKELLAGDPALPESIRDLGGLWVKARLDLEEPRARQAWKLMKSRRVKEFSFAYDVPAGGERRSSDGANDLVELEVIEVGPTLKGMNPVTQLIDVKTIPHSFVASDDDPSRCALCGLTKPTNPHINQLSTEADRSKAYVTLEGSYEARQEAIYRSILSLGPALEQMANGGFYAAYIEATYEDRVVALIEGWDDPMFEGRYWQFPVTTDDADNVTLGEAVEVAVQGVATPKARRKALRRLADDPHDHVKSDGNPEDPQGNGEDLSTRNGSAGSGEASRALVELEALSI